MDKILEVLKGLLPEEQVKELSSAVEGYLNGAKGDLEAEYTTKLEEAFAELSKELKEAEKTAYAGYQEAWGMIQELRNRMETQKEEFEAALIEGYEEAYAVIEKEKSKNDNISAELYEEYDKRLAEMKEYIVEKVDEFLKFKGSEIYEQARRDVLNDPRMAEHKVALEKIVDITADYLSDEDFALATSSKLEEAHKALDAVRGEKRILEGRNVRLSTENQKLSEQVRQAAEVINEARQQTVTTERKERVDTGKNASGRGSLVTEGIIPEHRSETPKEEAPEINETSDELQQMLVLSGLRASS